MVRNLYCLGPLIVLLAFADHRTRYILPSLGNLLALPLLFNLIPASRIWKGTGPLLLFVNAILAVVWLLSERHEGRDIESLAIPIEVALAGVGTLWISFSGAFKFKHSFGLFGFILIFAVGYLSTGTGSGSYMIEKFISIGMTTNEAEALTFKVRKTIHCLFYASVFWFMYRHFLALGSPLRYSLGLGFLVTLSVASFDEYRQSMVPNRTGAYTDVILDMSAASVALFLSALSQTIRSRKAVETR